MSQVLPIEVTSVEWEIVQKILQKYFPKTQVWAFGSRATRHAKKYSDLDLAIITAKPLELAVSSSLAEDFAQSDLPYKVDIVDWSLTSPAFQKIIESQRVVIHPAQ